MMNLLTLVLVCAPFVSSNTMMAIIGHESAGNPWALGVNGSHRFQKPTDYGSAVAEAKRLISKGASVDMGLMQINSYTMARLGLTVEQIYDPCSNIYAGGVVLTRNYVKATDQFGDPQSALQAALSAYNTGNFRSGFKNGYVRSVLNQAQRSR
ncbi:lytic transglycosylase domain-containing protein [Pseudomonas cichorii]|nr:lytic transglycosylase domain-containing protein [Pseudomonas cichorii]MBX8493168.1 lytic transglycosylase domain-containing protein [Pseudomonas cichorii]